MSNELADTGRILIYQNEKGDTKIDVYFDGDTIWLSQRTMAELYQVGVRTINEHITNIYDVGELDENRTIRNFRIVQYAELQAKQHHVMHMADWEEKLNQFLQFNGRDVLQNFGNVKREIAEALAITEYEKYDAHRKMIEAMDVDELAEEVKQIKN